MAFPCASCAYRNNLHVPAVAHPLDEKSMAEQDADKFFRHP